MSLLPPRGNVSLIINLFTGPTPVGFICLLLACFEWASPGLGYFPVGRDVGSTGPQAHQLVSVSVSYLNLRLKLARVYSGLM